MSSAIGIEDLAKTVRAGERAIAILRDVSLTIDQGEFVALTGPSGSGKSTLLHLIGLLDRPSSGRLSILGKDTEGFSSDDFAHLRAASIGFVFQTFHLIPHLTVAQNIALPLKYARSSNHSDNLPRLIDRFGLKPVLQNRPATLSGGEKQRVAIARALINNPQLVLADEPTGALDSENSRHVLDLLKEINGEGKTILMVTHDRLLARAASRVLSMRDGRLEPAA